MHDSHPRASAPLCPEGVNLVTTCRLPVTNGTLRGLHQDDAPSFFGQETRYGHRVYGGIVLNVLR